MKAIKGLLFSLLILVSCSGENTESEWQYDLDHVDPIDVELEVEIGETDNYIPGGISNIIVADNGDILVADGVNVSIEQFGSDGRHIRTVARKGNGPTEVPQYFSIADMGMGKFIVRHPNGVRNYLERQPDGSFAFGEAFLTEPYPGRGRMVQFAKDDEVFYAIATTRMSIQSPSDIPAETIQHVAIANQYGELLQDSLQAMTNRGLTYYTSSSNYTMPYIVSDELKNLNDGRFLITRPKENTFEIYNSDNQLEKTVTLSIKPRPYVASDVEQYVKNMIMGQYSQSPAITQYLEELSIPQSVQSEIAERVGEYRPLYVEVWVNPEEEKYLLQTDYAVGDEMEMAVLDSDGSPLGKFTISKYDDIYYFRDNKVYTVHEDPARGFFVRVYSLDI